MRSKVTRRMSVDRSAGGDNVRLFVLRRARMKASMMEESEGEADFEEERFKAGEVGRGVLGVLRVAASAAEERRGWRDQWRDGLPAACVDSAAEPAMLWMRLRASNNRKSACTRAWGPSAIDGRARFVRWS